MSRPTDKAPELSEQPAVELDDGSPNNHTTAMQVIVKHLEYIKMLALSLAPPDDPEDLVQDIIIRLATALAVFRHDCSTKTFIWRVSVQVARDKKKKWSRRNGILTPAKPGLANQQDNSLSNDDLYSRKEEIRLFYVALDEQEASDREILISHYINEISISELAEMLNLATGNVKMRLLRARRRLRATLEKNPIRLSRRHDYRRSTPR